MRQESLAAAENRYVRSVALTDVRKPPRDLDAAVAQEEVAASRTGSMVGEADDRAVRMGTVEGTIAVVVVGSVDMAASWVP